MDALLGMPLPEIVGSLPMSAEVRSAVLDRSGRLGRMLMLAEALEQDDAMTVAAMIAAVPGATAAQINYCQMQALRWATSIAQPRV